MNLIEKYRRFKWLLRLDVWVLRGKEPSSGEPLAFAFAGTEAYKNYLAQRVFGRDCEERYLGQRRVLSMPTGELVHAHGCSFGVFEIWKERERLFNQPSHFRCPVWLRVDMDLSAGVEPSIRKRKLTKMLRVIRNHGLESYSSREPADFEKFYSEMYAPYVLKKHGSAAILASREELRRQFSDCELLFIKKENDLIAASMIDYGQAEPHLLYCGVKNGSEEYLKLGAMDALYYFAFQSISGRGKTLANLGHCRAFAGDGVLRAKLELGARIAGTHYAMSGFLKFKFFAPTPAVRSFLARNPFISDEVESGYRACAFTDSGAGLLGERGAKLLEDCSLAGLTGTDVYAFEDWNRPDVLEFARSRPGLRVFPALSLFGESRQTAPWQDERLIRMAAASAEPEQGVIIPTH